MRWCRSELGRGQVGEGGSVVVIDTLTGEVLALAKSCGIDAQAMRETLLKCPAKNTTLERWDTTKFTWHQKDMDVALELSQQAGLALPMFGLVDQLVKGKKGPERKAGVTLTRREIEVLRLIAEEYSNPEIADKLFISIRTVDTHRRNLLEKLGLKNTAGLVKYAIKHGLADG